MSRDPYQDQPSDQAFRVRDSRGYSRGDLDQFSVPGDGVIDVHFDRGGTVDPFDLGVEQSRAGTKDAKRQFAAPSPESLVEPAELYVAPEDPNDAGACSCGTHGYDDPYKAYTAYTGGAEPAYLQPYGHTSEYSVRDFGGSSAMAAEGWELGDWETSRHAEQFDLDEHTEAAPSEQQGDSKFMSRRALLKGSVVAGIAGGAYLFLGRGDGTRVNTMPTEQAASPVTFGSETAAASPASARTLSRLDNGIPLAPVDQRVLVLIELEGGNDSLSTLVPYASGTYYDTRPKLAIAQEEVIRIDDHVGWNPALTRLSQRNFAAVEGVGPVDGVLSHFEMVKRWELGSMSGDTNDHTGLLARVVGQLPHTGPVTGLSVAGHTPRFSNSAGSTLSIEDLGQLRVLVNDDWIYPAYRSALSSFSGGPMTSAMAESWSQLFAMGNSISSQIPEINKESAMYKDGGQLGRQLSVAAEMIKADVGVRVIHASLNGFDTHDGHEYKHARLMGEFDVAVDGFLALIEDAGLADRVLVATTSEFGRRVKENGSGFDHGAASVMMLAGPIAPGRYGEPSPLDSLDDNGNLKTTIPFDRYLATLFQDYLGVDAAAVMPQSPSSLGLF